MVARTDGSHNNSYLIFWIYGQWANHADAVLDGDRDRPHDCLLVVLWVNHNPRPLNVPGRLLLSQVTVLVLEGQALGPRLQAVGGVDQAEDLGDIHGSGFSIDKKLYKVQQI